MVNMTLSIPEDVHKDMKNFPEIRWSEIARRAIVEKVEMLKKVEKIAEKSALTRKDSEEIGRKVKKGMTERFLRDHRLRL